MPQQYGFGRTSDSSIIRLFQALKKLHSGSTATFTVFDNASFSLTDDGRVPDQWSHVMEGSSYFIGNAHFRNDQIDLKLYYYRGQVFIPTSGGSHAWRRSENPLVDGLQIEGPNRDPQEHAPKILACLQEFIALTTPNALVDPSASSLSRSDTILDRISSAAATLVEQTGHAQLALNERRMELESQTQEQLERERAALKAEYDKKFNELNEREAAVEDIEESRASNTVTRRNLQKGMAEISSGTLKSRLLDRSSSSFLFPVVISVVGAIASAILAFSTLGELSAADERLNVTTLAKGEALAEHLAKLGALRDTMIFLEARALLLGGGAAALIWFALRLCTARYRQISRWENELHRYRLDTERASFLVEGDLEARSLSGQPLPQVVLDRFSRGLFAGSGDGAGDAPESVGNTLTTLLDRAASLKLGQSGIEVSVDKSGINKARKALEGSGEN